MAENLPAPAPQRAKLRIDDIAAIEADVRRAVIADRPATDALWTALLKPRDVILRRYRETMARMAEAATTPDTGIVDPSGREMGAGPAALIAIAETTVARAILGEDAMIKQVFDRIEGVPVKRAGDADDSANPRGELVASIEELVRDMYARRRPGDGAIDVTPKPNGHANGHDEPKQ